MSIASFQPAVREWFLASFGEPTRVQRDGWARIGAGEHALLLAPTGSGKTLAAFLSAIDGLYARRDAEGVQVLYVSPLKALVVDVERNLRAPLAGIAARIEAAGGTPPAIRVDVRTGDTSARDRRLQRRNPAEILVTTPESLFLLLGTEARETLRPVRTVIVDEIHALAGTKRGVHLAVSLERLSELCGDPQRIGLSATQRPLATIAAFLGGDRPVSIVDASAPPALDLQVVVPVAEMGAGMWPAIWPKILELIRAHRSTIVFTNSRLLCERLAKAINELAGEELVRAHHGSIAHERRAETEAMLKDGSLRAIVATSSLELGIDMGAVDLVVQVESPGSVARGLQRIGRAGHHVGGTSEGRILPKYRHDLVESAVVAREMLAGRIEETRVPERCLDVLAQQVVAILGAGPRRVDELEALIRRAMPYRELTRDALVAVLDMLAGRYPSEDFAELRPRIVWDRDTDTLRARKGSNTLALVNAGTIPDRGLYGVFVGAKGPRVGELDEEMVFESRPGQTIVLGASTWRIEEITRDRVVVAPAPGEPGRMPFWRGEGPGRPIELGRALGAFLEAPEVPEGLLDAFAAQNLAAYLAEQRAATGALPSDRTIVVERFRDELGDWRICILSPFGARVHAPWTLALDVPQSMYTDDGIALRLDADERPSLDWLFPDPEAIEERVVEALRGSAIFAARFRESAARALLLPRRMPGRRTPLWMQRLKAANLLAVAGRWPSFPIVLETYREILRDVFDLPALVELLAAVRRREVRVVEAETPSPSPFAKNLVFAWVADWLYEGDAPLAERKAQALTLDRGLLRELLGQAELRDLLDPEAIAGIEADLQRLVEDRRARDVDHAHDLLRRLGDLREDEIAARSDGDWRAWLDELARERRAARVRIAGEERWVAIEDVARYRDAVGAAVPAGLPEDLLRPPRTAGDVAGRPPPGASGEGWRPLEDLILRWARTHGPFLASEPAARLGLPAAAIEPVLRALRDENRLEHGEIRPGGTQREWCDPDVLRRLRRASLASLREAVAPVGPEVLARFLPRWQGLAPTPVAAGVPPAVAPAVRLREVVAQLEGLPLPWSELERSILPARIPGFRPQLLDELGAMGEIAWVGRGALGKADGRVVLVRRERVPLLVEPPGAYEGGAVHAALLSHLRARGASFLVQLQAAAGAPLADVVAALWDLVWAGQVTNDTFQPLRELGAPRGKRGVAQVAGGRWALVADLVGDGADPTRVAHARATMLLERYGLVAREAAAAEELPGGFAAVYPVLRSMEEQGRARRGWFVEGLAGAQFALPGAVDRLRAVRDRDDPEALVLAAVDPANPYGALLPWPDTGGRARRVAGASVVLVDGHPALFVDKGGKSLVTFPALADDAVAEAAVAGLRAWLGRERKRSARFARIDGVEATAHPDAARLVGLGLRSDYKAIVLERA